MIKRSKNREEKPDFDDIVNDIEQKVETQQVEQNFINQLHELKQLSSVVDKATTAAINAKSHWSLQSVSLSVRKGNWVTQLSVSAKRLIQSIITSTMFWMMHLQN